MLKRDILLRWTQELAKVIARLLGKEPQEALPIMDEAYRELLKTDPETLRRTPLDQLLTYLQEEKQLNDGQLEFVAELLRREAELLYENDALVQSSDRYRRALLIFEYLDQHQEVFSFERQETIGHIRRRVGQAGKRHSDH